MPPVLLWIDIDETEQEFNEPLRSGSWHLFFQVSAILHECFRFVYYLIQQSILTGYNLIFLSVGVTILLIRYFSLSAAVLKEGLWLHSIKVPESVRTGILEIHDE